ncbi:MAG: hypothetical protein ABJN34_17485 [Litoreibacter sp.]|uniref:hypothetical protein n=1 Tax=Litoreibacter sp. TaxID=1969459 RepID=UPI003299251E
MVIFKIIRILGIGLMLGAFVMIGHSYHRTMSAPATANATPSAQFLNSKGREVSRLGTGEPSVLDSIKLAWANYTGKEPEQSNDLAGLHARTAAARAPAPGSVEAVLRETEFWTDFTSKLGFTGP